MQKLIINRREMPYEVNEAMKLLRTNLQFCGKDKKVFMITSTLASEGKSTVSINLCRSLAQLGSRVVLVDADMRKSVLADRYSRAEMQFSPPAGSWPEGSPPTRLNCSPARGCRNSLRSAGRNTIM